MEFGLALFAVLVWVSVAIVLFLKGCRWLAIITILLTLAPSVAGKWFFTNPDVLQVDSSPWPGPSIGAIAAAYEAVLEVPAFLGPFELTKPDLGRIGYDEIIRNPGDLVPTSSDGIFWKSIVAGRDAAVLELLALAAREARREPEPPCRNCGYAGWAEVRVAAPETMRYREPAQIGLALIPSEASVDPDKVLDPSRYGATALRDPGPQVRVALSMQATVTAPGEEFAIEPAKWEVRNVSDLSEPMTWSWFVTPRTFGRNKTLTIRFQAVLLENGVEKPFGSREETVTVTVDVTPWGQMTHLASEVTAVHGMLAGVGTSGVVVVGWMLGWFRRPKPKEPLRVEFSVDRGDRENSPLPPGKLPGGGAEIVSAQDLQP